MQNMADHTVYHHLKREDSFILKFDKKSPRPLSNINAKLVPKT